VKKSKITPWTKAPNLWVVIFFFSWYHVVDFFGHSAGAALVKDYCVSFLCVACLNIKGLMNEK